MLKTIIMGLALTSMTATAYAQNYQNISDIYSHGYRLDAEVAQDMGIVINRGASYVNVTTKLSDKNCYINMLAKSSDKSRILKQGRVIHLDTQKFEANSLTKLVSTVDKSVSSLEFNKGITSVEQLESACDGLNFTVVPNLDFLDEAMLYDEDNSNRPLDA